MYKCRAYKQQVIVIFYLSCFLAMEILLSLQYELLRGTFLGQYCRSRQEYLDLLLNDLCKYYSYGKFLMEKFMDLFPLNEVWIN